MELSDYLEATKQWEQCEDTQSRSRAFEDAFSQLKLFTESNEGSHTYCDRGYPISIKEEFIADVLNRLDDEGWDNDGFSGYALLALRLLSRERKGLKQLHDKQSLQIMLRCACQQLEATEHSVRADEEGIKCLVNATHSNPAQQDMFIELDGPITILKQAHETVLGSPTPTHAHAYVWYALRLLFVGVATTPAAMKQLVENGGERLCVEMFEVVVGLRPQNSGTSEDATREFEPPNAAQNVVTELSNILFSVTGRFSQFRAKKTSDPDLTPEEKAMFTRLMACVYVHLSTAYENQLAAAAQSTRPKGDTTASSVHTKRHAYAKGYAEPVSLACNSVHSAFSVLYNTPDGVESAILEVARQHGPEGDGDGEGGAVAEGVDKISISSDPNSEADGFGSDTNVTRNVKGKEPSEPDTQAIDMWVAYIYSTAKANQQHQLLPMLSVTRLYAHKVPVIRRHLRAKILPRRTREDCALRPEQEDTVRGSLVKLMTSIHMNVKDLVADMLYVLCKEDMNRLIRHTGYGNAAGLLASKGLLSGGSDLTTTLGMYSDDSGGSDDDGSDSINDAKLTEDIERSTSTQHRKSTSDTGAGSSSSKAEPSVKPKINPVTGSYFSTKPNPMEGLSEEDKEREAEKLMTLFNRLEKNGVMKVMGTNKDGKQVEIPRSPMPPKDG